MVGIIHVTDKNAVLLNTFPMTRSKAILKYTRLCTDMRSKDCKLLLNVLYYCISNSTIIMAIV